MWIATASRYTILVWQTDNGGEFKGDFPKALGDNDYGSQAVTLPVWAHGVQSSRQLQLHSPSPSGQLVHVTVHQPTWNCRPLSEI